MIYLNLGCGATRPRDPLWMNIDNLHPLFPDPECPERRQMDREDNFVNHDISQGLGFLADDSIAGVLMSHVLEHFDLQAGMCLLRECRRVLEPGGVLRISVPDPDRFHCLTVDGCQDWGEPNPCADTLDFMQYALFFIEHKQLITKAALQCMFHALGFRQYEEKQYQQSWKVGLGLLDNRPKFSLFMEAAK